jgi:hypothetical protein
VKQNFDIAETERKDIVEPHRILNIFGRKPMIFEEMIWHIQDHITLEALINLTMPFLPLEAD